MSDKVPTVGFMRVLSPTGELLLSRPVLDRVTKDMVFSVVQHDGLTFKFPHAIEDLESISAEAHAEKRNESAENRIK